MIYNLEIECLLKVKEFQILNSDHRFVDKNVYVSDGCFVVLLKGLEVFLRLTYLSQANAYSMLVQVFTGKILLLGYEV